MKKLLLAALASAPASALAGPLEEALTLVQDHARADVPAFTDADLRKLARGGTVTRILAGGPAPQVIGARVVEAPRDAVWRALHDPAVVADPSVTEVRLSARPDGTEIWYGRMRLPSPLADRQWVVRSEVVVDLHAKSGGRAWERAWTELDEGMPLALPALASGHVAGLGPSDLDSAITTPTNRGGWLAITLDDSRTLLMTHAATDLGGTVPAFLVRDVARQSVVDLLARVARASGRPHPEVVRGDGA